MWHLRCESWGLGRVADRLASRSGFPAGAKAGAVLAPTDRREYPGTKQCLCHNKPTCYPQAVCKDAPGIARHL